jgi:DNA invertase Pin-like site-specific DNA recombinase
MNAVAYVRVSSKAQTFEMQRSALERAAAARGDRVTSWFSEKQTARTLARPELVRLRAAARAGEVRRLYVFRLDRLARSGIRDTFEVVEELRAAGVDIVTVADGFNLDGPAAEVVLAVLAWAAKMERLAINERIAAARLRLEKEGRSWGRPPRVSPLELARLRRWRDQGLTIRDIAQRAGIPRATVARALSQKHPAPSRSERPAGAGRAGGGRK